MRAHRSNCCLLSRASNNHRWSEEKQNWKQDGDFRVSPLIRSASKNKFRDTVSLKSRYSNSYATKSCEKTMFISFVLYLVVCNQLQCRQGVERAASWCVVAAMFWRHNLDLRSSQMVRILKRRNKADGPSFFTNNWDCLSGWFLPTGNVHYVSVPHLFARGSLIEGRSLDIVALLWVWIYTRPLLTASPNLHSKSVFLLML